MLNSLTDMNPVIAPMAMREWEEAGRLLANTLDNYLKMSTFLETSHLQGNDSGKDLINGIDSSLQTLQDQHKTLDQKFHRSRVALAKAWNRFASPIYHRPEEILSEIFLCVIYCPSNDPSCAAPLMATRVRTTYLHLYNLMGVCTVWRNVGLHRPDFWSIIPMVDAYSACWRPLSAELSVQRSGCQKLHLVVDATYTPACSRTKAFLPLIQQAARIQVLNIRSEYRQDIPYYRADPALGASHMHVPSIA